MFRRRPPGRPLRPGMAPQAHPLLRRANDLMAAGNYAEAAQAFEQLANGALSRGIPRAPQLFLQAGRCRVLAGQAPVGMAHLEQGLRLFAGQGRLPELHRAGARVVAELNQRGLAEEAARIEALLKGVLPAEFIPTGPGPAKKAVLPTSCPGCGGPIRSDEVEWIDTTTAECPFCGSAVRVE
ncbi:MAG: hypothetical protein JXB85_00650 [Anaerolineales bacterium]|nr:hypothetical protein [Anaerolineales bacterium]